jgi:hypothetical protein
MSTDSSRRQFLFQGVTGVSAAWISANWPSLLAAADHARNQAKSAGAKKLEFFAQEEAVEVEAVCERILPADDSPGARDAGVLYFIDRSLVTFAKDRQPVVRNGLPALQTLSKSKFPQYAAFSQASAAEQDQILQRLEQQSSDGGGGYAAGPAGQNFFGTIRWLTIAGFSSIRTPAAIPPESVGSSLAASAITLSSRPLASLGEVSLESALARRPLRKPFRIRTYENMGLGDYVKPAIRRA